MGLMMTGSFTPNASRTVAGKVRQTVYNVMDYGALGDNSHDDTTAIQNAINAASAAGGGTVLIPAGTFKTTAAIQPLSNVCIKGMGSGVTTVAGNGTNFGIFVNQAVIGAPTTDIEICDMKIDGTNVTTGTPNTGYKAIYIQYSVRLKIHGVYAYNTYATGIGIDFLVDSEVDRCVVDSCGVRGVAAGMGTGANGIGIGTGAYAVESWVVSNCIAKGTGNNGIMMEDQFHTTRSAYMTVSNCISYGGKFGFLNSGVDGVSFVNCWAANNTNVGFQALTGDIGSLVNNFNPRNINFIGCFSMNNGTGVASDGFLIRDQKPDGSFVNVLLDSCTSVGNTSAGYEIRDVASITMNNCTAQMNNSHGALVYSTDAIAPLKNLLINGGQYYNNSQSSAGASDGIRVGSSGAGTSDNLVICNTMCYDNQGTQTQGHGISIAGTTNNTNIFIHDNDLRNNKTSAFSSGSIATLVLRDNQGYNPVGQSSISVTASPFTYTAGNSPEDVYITGGTVSGVVKGSTTLAGASPAAIHLEPNQSITVTYSVLPTMVKDVW